jgi:hypothetical protein
MQYLDYTCLAFLLFSVPQRSKEMGPFFFSSTFETIASSWLSDSLQPTEILLLHYPYVHNSMVDDAWVLEAGNLGSKKRDQNLEQLSAA